MLARHMGKNTPLGRTSLLGIRFISQIAGSHPVVGTALGTGYHTLVQRIGHFGVTRGFRDDFIQPLVAQMRD